MSIRNFARRPTLARASVGFVSLIALAQATSASAADECGAAVAGGTVTCAASPDPYTGIRYERVTDFDLVLEPGVVVDGSLAHEPDTAVVVYGEGAISVRAEDGTVIRNVLFPAMDVVSNSGPVSVRADQVYGGSVAIAALANGDVTVAANHVEGQTGIQAESLGGNVAVDVGTALGGAGGVGVYAGTTAGDVQINAGDVRSLGDWGYAVSALSESGSVGVNVGFALAEGAGAIGLLAQSGWDGNVTVDVGGVGTFGDWSIALLAAAGLGDVTVNAGDVGAFTNYGGGLVAFAMNGAANVTVGSAYAAGTASRAIDIGALTDVSVVVGNSAVTDGADSAAISVETTGDVTIDAGRVSTYGPASYGVTVVTGADVRVAVDEMRVYGEGSAAVYVQTDAGDVDVTLGEAISYATTGDWFAVGLNSFTGDVALTIDDYLLARSGWAVTMASEHGGASVTVAEGAELFGQTTAINSATALGTRIDVAGTVHSGVGPVIEVFGNANGAGAADIRIASTGAVHGRLALSGGDDVVANAGAFLAGGVSDFGAGGDRLVNTGRLGLQDGATAAALVGLETLENRGLISLANGRAGDSLAVSGVLQGGAGSILAVDLDLVNGEADLVEVGDLTGRTELRLAFVGRAPGLGLDGLRIVTSEGTETGDELTLADSSRTRGFVGYRLEYDGQDSWLLESDLNDPAYLAGAAAAGVRDLWRLGADALSTHLTATRETGGEGGAWVQAVGGAMDGTSRLSHAQGARTLEWTGSHRGLQAGADKRFGGWQAGFTAGYGTAEMSLGGGEDTRLDALNLGLYAGYAQDGWFGSAVVRADLVDLRSNWGSIGLEAAGDGTALGVSFEGGRRFDLGGVWLEPAVRFAWVDVRLADQEGVSGDLRWKAGAAGAGEVGLRMGAADGWLKLPVRPYLSMALAREFGAGDQTVYDLGGDEVRVTAEGRRTFGRFGGGVAYAAGRFDLYGEVDGRFGDLQGLGGVVGARLRF